MIFSLLHSIHMADSGTFPDGSEFDGLNKREGNFTSKFCQIHDFSSMRAVLYDLVGFSFSPLRFFMLCCFSVVSYLCVNRRLECTVNGI